MCQPSRNCTEILTFFSFLSTFILTNEGHHPGHMVVRDDGETRGEGGYCVDCTASLSEGGSLTLLRLMDVR